MNRVFTLLLALCCCTLVTPFKILCFFPTISKSQWVFGEPLFSSLAVKGHQVTVVSPYSSGKNLSNYNEVVIPIDFGEHSSSYCKVNLYLYACFKVSLLLQK